MEEETISLKEIFLIIRKRIGLILTITFTATMISAIISFFLITPTYQVSTQLLVSRSQVNENFTTGEIQTNIQLINTYSGIITSPRILDIVADELDSDITPSAIKNKINVQNDGKSQILSIVATDEDPAQAALIANKVAEVFQREIPYIMSVDNVNILAEAVVPDNISPVSPKPFLNIAIAFVVGAMLGVGLAFLLEYLDNTLKTEQDIENHLELPVLGVITTYSAEDFQQSTKRGRASRGERALKHG